MFDYDKCNLKFPIEIEGQKEGDMPCYKMTEDMELRFTFMRCKSVSTSSFADYPKDFIWKYTIQRVVNDNEEETVHGYFNLDEKKKTCLDLTNFEKTSVKWIRFTCFEPGSPQQRAWFLPIQGLAFGKPRHLLPRQMGKEAPEDIVPKMKHFIAMAFEDEKDEKVVEGHIIRTIKQEKEYFKDVYAVESKDLKFFFPALTKKEDESHVYAYYLQACPIKQDEHQLKKNLNKDIAEFNDVWKPPRILQNVHGYLELMSNYPTRLDLGNSWDKDKVFMHDKVTIDDKESVGASFVFFYAINSKIDKVSKTFRPMMINPRPYPIKTVNTTNENMLKNVSKVEKIDEFKKGFVDASAQNSHGLNLKDRDSWD